MKILLADPHPEVRTALHLVLDQKPGVAVLAEASSSLQLLALAARECPDLVLLDAALAGPQHRTSSQSLADMIDLLRRFCPRVKVVAMSSRFEAGPQALASGADGFISKTDAPDVVWAVIAQVCEKS